jgi:NAD-dependent deacetylase
MGSATSIVVLTGAGVSAESGVPTFRGKEGLWRNFRAEDLATPEAFRRDPALVWEWYAWRRGIIGACEPNPAHLAIADLERMIIGRGGEFLLVTQNVDGLHGKAGNERMVELHGNIWRTRCSMGCEEGNATGGAAAGAADGKGTGERDRFGEPLPFPLPPQCGNCGSPLRPDVVWFGESLDPAAIDTALSASSRCDLMLVVGTSAVVYPAASLPSVAKQSGAVIMEVNMEPTPVSRIADHSSYGKAGEVMPHVLEMIS